MDDIAVVISMARDALFTVILVSSPMLIIGMIVGLFVSLFQATTQIHEQTMIFVPKILPVFISLLIFGPWMLRTLMDFMMRMFANINLVVR